MVPRKRGRAEMESSEPAPETSQLTKLRNMWEFANVMQYIFIFGKAVKIDEDFDIEVPIHHTPARSSLRISQSCMEFKLTCTNCRTLKRNVSRLVLPRN